MADGKCPSSGKLNNLKSIPGVFDMLKQYQYIAILVILTFHISFISIEASESVCKNCEQGSCVNNTASCVCLPGWRGVLCNECSGRIKLNAGNEGVIYDGSGNYSQDLTCSWLIHGEKGLRMTLKVNSLATECIWDHIYVHNGDSAFSPLMAAYSGFLWERKRSPYFRFKLEQQYAFIHFYSDAAFTLPGFNITYKIDNCSLDCSEHGICNDTVCQCEPGWTGENCDVTDVMVNGCPDNCTGIGECVKDGALEGYGCTSSTGSLQIKKMESPAFVTGRASLALVAQGDTSLWVMGGYRMMRNEQTGNLFKFRLSSRDWENPQELGATPWPRYGHASVFFNNKLFLYGGVSYTEVKSDLWEYNIYTWTWTELQPGPRNLSGHTAHVFRDSMIVIFGFSPDYGYSSEVLEYNFDSSTWSKVETTGSRVNGGYGHSSVFDERTEKIYVYGGHHGNGESYKLTDKLYEYDPATKAWFILRSSGKARYLHAAFMMNGLMVVYGGNTYNDTRHGRHAKCFASDFMAYDRRCNRWHNIPSPVTDHRDIDLDRFGHAAVAINNVAYMFGGFNAIVKNDLLEISAGDCTFYENRQDCDSAFPGVKCQWWNETSCREAKSTATCQGPEDVNALCSGHNRCGVCQDEGSCGWCPGICVENSLKGAYNCSQEAPDCSAEAYEECGLIQTCVSCQKLSKCIWQAGVCKSVKGVKSEKAACERSTCKEKDSCSLCTKSSCMWCSSLRQCIDTNAYVVYFFYGQCMHWATKEQMCEVNTCANQKTCADCQARPQCGWCDDDSGTGTGFCHEGGMEGPRVLGNGKYELDLQKCPADRWFFETCPLCQCNGHSLCINGTDKCESCQAHTMGDQCQSCENGYFGNALNGGNCTACVCNGQADSCHPETGDCYCKTRGVIGRNCDKCDDDYKYPSETSSGGICYYTLNTDFQYTFNLSKNYSQINFLNIPTSSDRDLDFTLNCSTLAFINITYKSKSFPEEKEYIVAEPCDFFRHKFEHKDFKFAGKENTTFMVYIYDFKTPFKLQISFSQFPKIDLVHFFVTFFSCFLSLLLIAAALWKIKHKYDSYRRRQQHNLEMEEMASRPFSTIAVEIERKSQPVVLDKRDHLDSVLRRRKRVANKPSAIAVEPLMENKAAILTLIIQLPTGTSDFSPSGQSGLALGSALVSVGSHRKQSLDHAKDKPKIRKHLNVHSDTCA